MPESDKYVYINIGVGVESVYVRIKKDAISATCPYSPEVVLFCRWRTGRNCASSTGRCHCASFSQKN